MRYDYLIYPIPQEIRGVEYLNLLHSSIEGASGADAGFHIERFSWKALIFGRYPKDVRRIIHLHWETNVYGSEYAAVSIIRMLYRFPLIMAAKLRGAKLFWTIHNLKAHDYPHPRIDDLGRSIVWKLADAVHIQLRGYAETAKRLHPDKRIFYIPLPNFVGVFGPAWAGDRMAARREYGLQEGDTVLLAFGNVRPYKALPSLIDAVAEARSRGAKVSLIIAGKATAEYGSLIADKARGAPGIVLRLGYVPDPEAAKLLGLSDYSVVYYSESSLHSAVLLSSLSYGVPVITRDIPASELISRGRNGFIFHSQDELVRILCDLPKGAPAFDKDDIIASAGPDWRTLAADLVEAYESMWPAR